MWIGVFFRRSLVAALSAGRLTQSQASSTRTGLVDLGFPSAHRVALDNNQMIHVTLDSCTLRPDFGQRQLHHRFGPCSRPSGIPHGCHVAERVGHVETLVHLLASH